MTDLYQELKVTLKKDPRVLSEKGDIMKSKVYDLAMALDGDFLKILLDSPFLSRYFFSWAGDIAVFDKVKFSRVLMSQEFLQDNVTRSHNKIGRIAKKEFNIGEREFVCLTWPYEDCIIEGGQTQDDPFYSKLLSQEQAASLLGPKVFARPVRHVYQGSSPALDIEETDNLVIQGNNLLVLPSLQKRYQGKVKCIYIDVPYYFPEKKANNSFYYNTNFTLSSWLTLMKNCLELAKEFLRPDGVIWIQVGDDGQAYMKVLCDEIFQGGYINTISVKMKTIAGASGGGEDKKLKKNIEFIHAYAKDYTAFTGFHAVYDYKEIMEVQKEYRENQISWKYTSVLYQEGNKKYLCSTVDGDGNEIAIYGREGYKVLSVGKVATREGISEKEVYYRYIDRIFTTSMPQSSIRPRVMKKLEEEGITCDLISIAYVPKSGKNKGKLYEQFYKGGTMRLLTWLKDVVEVRNGLIYKKDLQGTLWDGLHLNNLNKEGKVDFPNGKKPEALLKRILEMTTEKGDLVMDFFAGSGTTAAVAHKLGRQYIAVEQVSDTHEMMIRRLKNVIEGEQGGISKETGWQGGGSFVSFGLKMRNETNKKEIMDAVSEEKLNRIYEKILESGFVSDQAEETVFEDSAFLSLNIEDKKKRLMEILDKHMLYVNFCDWDDLTMYVTPEEKAFTESFYRDNATVLLKEESE